MMTNFFFIVASIIIFSSITQPAMSRPHDNTTDLESLLAFKSGVYDPYDFLATNWTPDSAFCTTWFGVECRRHRVFKLDIHNLSLYGTVSPHLGNLSFLTYLNLGENNLTSRIPDSLARLPRLAVLGLHNNNLSGLVHPDMFNMSSLTQLSLALNELSGPLPSNIILPVLKFLSISLNNFTGSIPPQLARCSQLRLLSLSYNRLSGEIPSGIGNLTVLEDLYLGSNRLSGTIPASIGNLTMLRSLSISTNKLRGSIPEEFGKLMNLRRLQLRVNSLSGSLPTALLNASNLEYVELDVNELSGVVPTSIGESWPNLNYWSMYGNQLTGGLEFIASLSNCRNLTDVQLVDNKLDGFIPDSIGNLSASLHKLHLGHNYIKGKIPNRVGNLSGLFYLFLEENDLTGEVPPTVAMLKGLQGLALRGNKIGGHLPVELGDMTSLNYLDLSYNALSGSISYSLGNITTLYSLNLASNRLFSNIPESLWRLSGLIRLDLSKNALDGSLSLQMGKLKFLDILDLSKNHLSGNIPSSTGDLQMLTYLNLSNNSLHGEIPASIKGLINIEHLNLSYNSLSGNIPEYIVNLTHLYSLDLSFNKLEGQIPQGGSFSNLSVLSLEGNSALCGAIQLGFQPCPSSFETTRSKGKVYLLKYILPIIAFVAILAMCFYIGIVRRQRRRKLEVNAPLNEFSIIPYHELVRATDNFNDANLLGTGRFSSVFKACLDDGSVTAVKVLNLEDRAALKSFDVECSILGAVRHRNIVKIINTCSNLDFKALVLQFIPNGSLEQWLYSHNNYLSVFQRLNIIVDVSLALEYLHHDHPHTIIHCDLKPSNVLLDENMIAHVSDFGISKLLLGDSKYSILSASAPGTFGYIAPEYGSTGKISRKSDVYSFGVLLLEILTRKRPSDAMFDGGLTLRQWVSDSYPTAILNVVDPNIVAEGSTVHVHQCLSSLIEVALKCSRNLPKERFLIKEVVPILQKIRTNYLSVSNAPMENKSESL